MKTNRKLSAFFSTIGIITIGLALYAFKAYHDTDEGYTTPPQ
ncbi:MAG: hypothetical protein ACTHY4_04545 [Flavobacteriaceae bacterium]